jgi:hypothetical protein
MANAMPIRDQFVAAMPFIVGIGVPIGVLLSGTALPIAYDLKGSLGELKSSVAGIQRQLDVQDVQLRTLVSGRMKQKQTLNCFFRGKEYQLQRDIHLPL